MKVRTFTRHGLEIDFLTLLFHLDVYFIQHFL